MSNRIRNIIYIHTHDMGRYISPYGCASPTPNLQSFAKTATVFRQAYCCGPTCSPSRAGLLTGVTPHESGMMGLAHRGFKFTHPEYHLGAYLNDQGFLTALCGIQHEFNSAPEQMPYQLTHTEKSQGGHAATDRAWTQSAVDFLQTSHDQPFFLSYGLFYPHRPYAIDPESKQRANYTRHPAPLPDHPDIRQDMADYNYTVAQADECIGQVLDTIRSSGRDQDSLIVITTDHGIAFPKMKCNLTAHGTGVTLMMHFPGNHQAGKTSDALVSHLDIYPTICDLLDLTPPAHLQGASMRPLFEEVSTDIREAVASEVNFHAAAEPMRSIRTKEFNFIRIFDNDLRRPLANIDEGNSKTVMMRTDWCTRPREAIQLYDLLLDPNEANNVADDPRYQGVLAEMEERLNKWMKQTNDPLLNGPLEIPLGAAINSRESIDPAEKTIVAT